MKTATPINPYPAKSGRARGAGGGGGGGGGGGARGGGGGPAPSSPTPPPPPRHSATSLGETPSRKAPLAAMPMVPQSAPAPATKIGPSARPRGLRDDMAP